MTRRRASKTHKLVVAAREALMIRWQSREADCGEIREQLTVSGGRALRRGLPRHHVEHCEGCRAFATEVRRQKAELGVLLSVVPPPALKHSIFTAVSADAGRDAAAASGKEARACVAVTGVDGMGFGREVAAARSLAVRVLLALVVAGGAVAVARARQQRSLR